MRRGAGALAAGLALALSACGSDDEPATPAACLGGAGAYLAALQAAPGEASLGGTPLGDCLAEEQEAGQISQVGEALVAAATELNDRARRRPLGADTVRLGYLVGVVEARAEQTGGIHADLALRVESAATTIPEGRALPGGFQQRYEEGRAAGRASVAR